MYKHIEVELKQSSKHAGALCGDTVVVERDENATRIVLCDGIGSGVRANLAATMCASRLLELVRHGCSLREAFRSIVHTMNLARSSDLPFAAFTVVQVRPNGETSCLSYEIPPPLFVGSHAAIVLDQQRVILDNAVLSESHCILDPGDGILAMSDGITQAGLGAGSPEGWTSDGVCSFVSDLLSQGIATDLLADEVHRQARNRWRRVHGMPANRQGDDCTVVFALCRPGKVVNILSGPPANPKYDHAVIQMFLDAEGVKVVSGATTARLVAGHMGEVVQIQQEHNSLIAPPRSHINGIDLVTEGTVTLNQVYNLLDEDMELFNEDSGVTQFCTMLHAADRINLFAGMAPNIGNGDIAFKQQGILPRQSIIPLIEQKLKQQGKLVVVDWK